MTPLYDFECVKCATVTELFLKKPGPPKTIKCPKCRGRASRLFSLPARIINADAKIPKWSLALGKPVKNKKAYIDGLKRMGANWQMIMEEPY